MKESRIRVLSQKVANLVAAGEVIQCPKNVVKELLDNAIDAGATDISVAIVGAGKTSIQVSDNGVGMSAADACLCFERHATSKLREASDLDHLSTMGFRGEALASIAAVAEVTLITRQADDELGTKVTLAGGLVTGQESVQCCVGTTFVVENLFYNVPARRRFLREDSTERHAIISVFQQVALAHPHIAFTLYSNGLEMIRLPKANVEQRLGKLYGKKLVEQMLPLNSEGSVSVRGYVGTPASARSKSAQQMLYVNGRCIEPGTLRRAVTMAFDQLIPVGQKVPFILFLEMAPEEVDVNVSPAKTQVHFANESAVFSAIVVAVRDALAAYCAVPLLQMPQPTIAESISTHQLVTKVGPSTPSSAPVIQSSSTTQPIQTQLFAPVEDTQDTLAVTVRSYNHLQYAGTYILTPTANGMMVTHQRRAHERILFDRYMNEKGRHLDDDQTLLFAQPDDADAEDAAQRRRFDAALKQARQHSVVEGQHLTNDEMESLIGDLLTCSNSRFSPTGKPIFNIIPQQVFTSAI